MLKTLVLGAAMLVSAFASAADAASKTYVWESSSSRAFPRVAWCADHNSLCGQEAANRYCERQGFDHASTFGKDMSPQSLDGDPHLVPIPGSHSVKLVRRACNSDYCKTFAYITCADGTQSLKHHRKRAKQK